ncbi:hypothetical protein DAI22_12g222900 [Oryza sativa Japonica Group]|nr:hypothetical protein DAI22_12g222900 [Oryza sativa Japonica Group]
MSCCWLLFFFTSPFDRCTEIEGRACHGRSTYSRPLSALHCLLHIGSSLSTPPLLHPPPHPPPGDRQRRRVSFDERPTTRYDMSSSAPSLTASTC